MKHFFTADEHYGHAKIIEYCDRPFKDQKEMDAIIIDNHNKVVTPDDITYHVGDFTLRSTREADKYITRLNGLHHFVRGSHDYWADRLPYIIEKIIDGHYIVMCHYAMKAWPRSFHDSLLAYGHSHGHMKEYKMAHDVGVDNNNFYPVELKDFIIKAKQ